MKRTIILAMALGMATWNLQAQEGQGIPQQSGSSNFYLSNGIHIFGFGNLNKAISITGFPEVNEVHGSTGFGGFGTIGNFVLGGEGHNFNSSTSNDSATTRSEGGLGVFYLGYDFIEGPVLNFYPMIGLGFGGTTIHFQQVQSDMAFSNFMLSPLNSGEIGMGNVLLNFSVALDYKLRERNSLFVGLRGGYNFSGPAEWKSANFRFVDAPKDDFSSFFFLINVGISIGN